MGRTRTGFIAGRAPLGVARSNLRTSGRPQDDAYPHVASGRERGGQVSPSRFQLTLLRQGHARQDSRKADEVPPPWEWFIDKKRERGDRQQMGLNQESQIRHRQLKTRRKPTTPAAGLSPQERSGNPIRVAEGRLAVDPGRVEGHIGTVRWSRGSPSPRCMARPGAASSSATCAATAFSSAVESCLI